MQKDGLIRKTARLIPKFMTSQIGQQIITQADNNFWSVEIFFLKNHTKNVVEKLVPDPFVKSQN